jgi:PAS domain S-box-containing protein
METDADTLPGSGRTLVEALPAVSLAECATVLTIDTAGKVLAVNTNFEETAGYSRYVVLGRKITEIRDGRDVDLFRVLQGALRSSASRTAFVDGTTARHGRAEEISIVPVVDSVGRISQIVAIKRDVAAPDREERILRGRAFLGRIGWIVGSFAHHFNKLLTPIFAHAEIIRERLPEGDSARSSAEAILGTGRRVSAIIGRMLAFGRRLHLRPRPLDLNALVGSMQARIRESLGPGVGFETGLAPQAPRVYADPEQLERVLTDLAANACEAMPAGGRLSIETATVEIARTTTRDGVAVAPGEYAVVTVRDTGVGMDPETRVLVFEPFFSTKPGAVGLGLSSAYGFVKQTGGYIWVQGEHGKGAAVTVYLPSSRSPGRGRRESAC